MFKRKKPDSDGRLETMDASSSAAAVVVEYDSTKQPKNNCPKRKKTRAEMDKHNKHCRESRCRVKAKVENMAAESERMLLELQEFKNQKISDQEKTSKLESDLQAVRSLLQQKDEEIGRLKQIIGRLKQSPSEWQFEELRGQGIRGDEDLQEYILKSDNYKQDGQDPGNESGNLAANEHDSGKNFGLTRSDSDSMIYGGLVDLVDLR